MKAPYYFLVFLFVIFFSQNIKAQPMIPWDLDSACQSIITTGIVGMTCGITQSVPAGEQWTFGMADINSLIPASGRNNVTASTPMYHHPEWDVNFIGNVYGITMDDCGYTYLGASANYGSAYFGQQGIIRYGDIGGGAEDLSAAGTVYKLDKADGAPSVWAVLPQQLDTLINQPCEGGLPIERMTGPGLGNLVYSRVNKIFFVSNFEDGRIYRLNYDGDILDSYDPGIYDDGAAGVTEITDLAYGLAITDDGQTLIYGTIGTQGGYFGGIDTAANIFSIDLNPNGSFTGTVDNSVLPAGATYDNYVGTETLHTSIAAADLLNIFSDVFFISDLDITPSNQLMVGIRIGCSQTIASSYNHYGSTKVFSLDANGLYTIEDGTVITTGGFSLADNDSYGGVSWYENMDGDIEWVISAGDMLGEYGPHGITVINENTYGTVGNAASPAAIISYGVVDMSDPKGVGGEVQVFRECVCLDPIVCPEEVVAEVSPSVICSGESVTLSYTLDNDSVPVLVTWTDEAGTIITDPNQTPTNSDCAPATYSYTVQVICLEDSSIVLTDEVSVTVFTDDISPYVSGISDGECVIGVEVDSLCADYITIVDPIPIINEGDEGIVTISAVSSDSLGCASTSVDLEYDCPLCMITDLSALASACSGTDFFIDINLNVEDGATTFTATDGDGNNLGTYNYADLPVTLGPFYGDATLSYDIIVTDDADPNCTASINVPAPDCLCEITDVTATLSECDGLNYSIDIDVSGSSLSDQFNVDVNGTDFGTYYYADLPVNIGPFLGDDVTVQTITVTDLSDVACSFTIDAGPQACYICDVENIDLEYYCVDTLGFEAYLSFTGSNIYTITDGSTVWTDIEAGSGIFLGYYPENVDLTVTITDQLAEDCAFTVGSVSLDCDCDSEPGTIMVNSMFICPDDISIVDADDFLLEPGQSVYYLYHDQSSVSTSDLPDLNVEVYTTGSFLINDGAVIPCGDVVYVTAIGAYEDLDMPGFPDYDDFCLTVSNTVPVTFLCPIVITVDESCNTEFGEFTYTYMIDGGLPAVDDSQTYDVMGDSHVNSAVSAGEMVAVGPVTDLESYTLTATDANGCEASITHLVECEKVPIELVSFTATAKSSGNLLEWITAAEIENDYFTLLSSKDGMTFSAIAQLEGAGTISSEMRYSYLDTESVAQSAAGITYYQLQQTDYDGSSTMSSIISVDRTTESLLISEIYPVPADKFIGFIFSATSDADVILNISDLSGRTLSQQTVMVSEGRNDIHLDVESLSTGIYFISLDSDFMSTAQKFVKE